MSKFVTLTALVMTALSKAINEEDEEEVFAVKVIVYVSSGRFEKDARRFEVGPTRTLPEALPPLLRTKLTPNAARVAFP